MNSPKTDLWTGSEKHRIRVSEIDEYRLATLPALVGLMQEVAWNNSANLNYSVYDLMERGVTWVVYRMQIRINRYPVQQEELTVQSWPSGMDRLYTYRDYRINDGNNKEIARATSAWLVMDIKKRELIAVPAFIREGLDFERQYDRLELDRTKLKPVNTQKQPYEVKVRKFDMDVNGHVSNTLYFEWLLESLGNDVGKRRINYIDIQFKGEGKKGDELAVLCQKMSENEYLHQILNKNSGNELIRAKTEFK